MTTYKTTKLENKSMPTYTAIASVVTEQEFGTYKDDMYDRLASLACNQVAAEKALNECITKLQTQLDKQAKKLKTNRIILAILSIAFIAVICYIINVII